MSGTTAIVIDGHRSWLDLAESVLSAASVEVVGTAMSLKEGTRLLEERRPGLAVVETAMEETGADALSWLSATAMRFPDVTLIAVSESQDMDAEHGLTKREVEILRLAARGLSNGEIAKQLWVTEQTVKFHLANTYRKLGVSNRTGAARQAQLLGLLTEE